MSRAFVKEADGDAVSDDAPDLPISPHPNYVTPQGLKALQTELEALVAERSAIKQAPDQVSVRLKLFKVERRLRYVQARVESAILKRPEAQPEDEIGFGATVVVADEEDVEHVFRIVGEDEADVARGWVSYLSPLAKALIGAEPGDLVKWRRPVGDMELEVVSFGYE